MITLALTFALTFFLLGQSRTLADDNSTAGAKIFQAQCAVCHSNRPGENGAGPSLAGVVGRSAGVIAGFNYSSALKNSGLTWDHTNLEQFLTSSAKKVPGTAMAVSIPVASDRSDLIAYLSTLAVAAPAATLPAQAVQITSPPKAQLDDAAAMPATPVIAKEQIISITIAPPELPVYKQPPIPEPGYMWSPGYWAYGPDGYFWVPGTWVLPPGAGLLWTPGYWGWRDGFYAWNAGYWGPHVGFYGGVNYGFGYVGVGYEGGYWNNGVFAYNRSVNNFAGVRITNVYDQTVIANTSARVSFNGGAGGTTAQPTTQDQAAANEQHVAATPAQAQHQQMASTNKTLLASVNHGQPPIAATSMPGAFAGNGVVAAGEAKPVVAVSPTKASKSNPPPHIATAPKAAASGRKTGPGL